MNRKVLITGASGFVGFHLIEMALQEGMEVFAAIRPGSQMEHLRSFPIHFTTLDYEQPELLMKELEGKQYNYIIHAAGVTKAKSAEEYKKVNATYTRNLALAALQARIPLKKFVFISSLAALGPIAYQDKRPIQEQSLAQPVTSYGISKLIAEKNLSGIKNLPLIVLRPTAIYGPREKDIFIFLKTLNRGLDPYIGFKPQWLSFVHVKDLAQAVKRALASDKICTSYNISDGMVYDRYALAHISKQILGKKAIQLHFPLSIVTVVARILEAAHTEGRKPPALNREKLNELTAENWNCSIDKIKKELGFKPAYNLEEGLADTIKWYKDNKWL